MPLFELGIQCLSITSQFSSRHRAIWSGPRHGSAPRHRERQTPEFRRPYELCWACVALADAGLAGAAIAGLLAATSSPTPERPTRRPSPKVTAGQAPSARRSCRLRAIAGGKDRDARLQHQQRTRPTGGLAGGLWGGLTSLLTAEGLGGPSADIARIDCNPTLSLLCSYGGKVPPTLSNQSCCQ